MSSHKVTRFEMCARMLHARVLEALLDIKFIGLAANDFNDGECLKFALARAAAAVLSVKTAQAIRAAHILVLLARAHDDDELFDSLSHTLESMPPPQKVVQLHRR